MSKFSTAYFDKDSEMVDRFVEGAFDKNPNISNFGEFKSALFDYLGKESRGEGALNTIDEDDIIELFNNAKDKLRDNLTDEEFEELYGDGNKVVRIATSENSMVTITYPKIKSPSYLRKGKPVKYYERFKPRKFTQSETKFIQVRKQKKISTRQIIQDYNKHFKTSPRSYDSIKTKVYRV